MNFSNGIVEAQSPEKASFPKSQEHEKVQCLLCGKWKAFLNNNHFVKCHGITREEYMAQFQIDDPFELVAPVFRRALSKRKDYKLYTKEELEAEFWRIYHRHGAAPGKLFGNSYYPVFNQLLTIHGRWRFVLEYFGLDPETERLSTAAASLEARVGELKAIVREHGSIPEGHKQKWMNLRSRLGSVDLVYEKVGIAKADAFPEKFKSAGAVLNELREFFQKRKEGDTSPFPAKLNCILRFKFGSLGEALKSAGIDKHEFFFKKLWTKEELLDEIRKLVQKKADLRQGAVSKTRVDLVTAANKYFGSCYEAIEAAGFDSLQFRAKRFQKLAYIRETWPRERLRREMAALKAAGLSRNLDDVRVRNPELVLAANFYHGSWGIARRAHGLVESKSTWTQEKVLSVLRERIRRGETVTASWANLQSYSLYNAARKLFGSWRAALDGAGAQRGDGIE